MAGDPKMLLLSSSGVSMGSPTPAGAKRFNDVVKKFAPEAALVKNPAQGGVDALAAGSDSLPSVLPNVNQTLPPQRLARNTIGTRNPTTPQYAIFPPNGVQGSMLAMQDGPPAIGTIPIFAAPSAVPARYFSSGAGLFLHAMPASQWLRSFSQPRAFQMGEAAETHEASDIPPMPIGITNIWLDNIAKILPVLNQIVPMLRALNGLDFKFGAINGMIEIWEENISEEVTALLTSQAAYDIGDCLELKLEQLRDMQKYVRRVQACDKRVADKIKGTADEIYNSIYEALVIFRKQARSEGLADVPEFPSADLLNPRSLNYPNLPAPPHQPPSFSSQDFPQVFQRNLEMCTGFGKILDSKLEVLQELKDIVDGIRGSLSSLMAYLSGEILDLGSSPVGSDEHDKLNFVSLLADQIEDTRGALIGLSREIDADINCVVGASVMVTMTCRIFEDYKTHCGG